MSDTLEVAVIRATGLAPTDIRISPRAPLGYQSNRLYDVWANGRHLIAKEFLRAEELQDAPAREFRALELLARFDIAPRPVFFDPALGPTVFYEFMEGEMWDRRRPIAADLSQLAEVWLKMNAVPTDGLWMSRGYERSFHEIEINLRARFQAYADWADAEFKPGRRAVGLCLDVLNKSRAATNELAECKPLLCFCRADPRFANVIARPDGRLGWVDWEDSGLRDPARDLADLVTHPNQEDLLSLDEWQAFLQPYLAVRGQLDPQLAHRMHLYLAIFPIFWLTVLMNQGVKLARTGRLANWTINGLPANERLRRYLARALAWPQVEFQLETLANVEFFPAD